MQKEKSLYPLNFPSPAMIRPAQPYAVWKRCRNFVRRQKGGKRTECRFWGGKVVRFADFDKTFAKRFAAPLLKARALRV